MTRHNTRGQCPGLNAALSSAIKTAKTPWTYIIRQATVVGTEAVWWQSGEAQSSNCYWQF